MKPIPLQVDNTLVKIQEKYKPIPKPQEDRRHYISSDNRSDKERTAAAEGVKEYFNPSTRRVLGEGIQNISRYIANPFKLLGDVASTVNPNSNVAKDLPNTRGDILLKRAIDSNPFISNSDKRNNTMSEATELATMAGVNELVGYGMLKTAPYVARGLNVVGNRITGKVPYNLIETSKLLFKYFKNTPNRKLTESEINLLQRELDTRGILDILKTWNMPYKGSVRRGVEPWDYSDEMSNLLHGKYRDTFNLMFPFLFRKNPKYITENVARADYMHRFESNPKFNLLKSGDKPSGFTEEGFRNYYYDDPILSEKYTNNAILRKFKNRFLNNESQQTANRYGTWDMYLGLPLNISPMYKISDLSTTKGVVYTVKPEYTNNKFVLKGFKNSLSAREKILNPSSNGVNIKTKNEPILSEDGKIMSSINKDSQYGTMGNYQHKVVDLGNGRYYMEHNDVWDLHPFEKKKILGIFNPEIGKVLRIGKPLDVRVRYDLQGTPGNINGPFEILKLYKGGGNIKQSN